MFINQPIQVILVRFKIQFNEPSHLYCTKLVHNWTFYSKPYVLIERLWSQMHRQSSDQVHLQTRCAHIFFSSRTRRAHLPHRCSLIGRNDNSKHTHLSNSCVLLLSCAVHDRVLSSDVRHLCSDSRTGMSSLDPVSLRAQTPNALVYLCYKL